MIIRFHELFNKAHKGRGENLYDSFRYAVD